MPRALTVLGRLTAAEDRTLRGTLLPYGVPGHTNVGRVVAGPGAVAVPDDLSQLHASLDHLDARDSVAEFASVEDTPEGLIAEWRVPMTHGGDRLLAEFRSGVRTGVSVELEPHRIVDGQLRDSVLVGCAFPPEPAFPTARLMAELAPDTTDEDGDEDDDDVDDEDVDDDPQQTDDQPDEGETREDGETVTTTTDQQQQGAAAPRGLHAQRRNGGAAGERRRLLAERLQGPADLYQLLAEANGNGGDRRLLAALSDVTATGLLDRQQPQWLGELWSGTPYQRRIVPLINGAELTGLRIQGWRWVTRPEVAPWAGDKAAVPSNPIDTEPVEVPATRLAGAHDIDRAYRDFGDAAFFAAYYQAMTESYARQSDDVAMTELAAGATRVTMGAVPSGIDAAWVALVDAALAVVPIAAPSFAVVAPDVYRPMLLTPRDNVLEFLSAALQIDGGQLAGFRIVPDPTGTLTAGEVMVGSRAAATHYELPGTPIRAEALDMVRGGVDAGVFGYRGLVVHDDRALVIADSSPAV